MFKDKEKDNGNFCLSNERFGFRFSVGWKGMDLFLHYDFNRVVTNGNGPELNAFFLVLFCNVGGHLWGKI